MNIFSYIDTLETDNNLCHYDFHPDQIIQTKDGPYLIDWMSAVSGPPSVNVARTYLLFLTSKYSEPNLILRI
jgi:thiamine kinase-like enzyme